MDSAFRRPLYLRVTRSIIAGSLTTAKLQNQSKTLSQRANFVMSNQYFRPFVKDFMSTPLHTVAPDTPLKEAVQLLSDYHISSLPVVNNDGKLIGELTEKDLMVRESGIDVGPYLLLLDSLIYLNNPISWDKQVHQVLGSTVKELMSRNIHTCGQALPLSKAAKLLNDRGTQRLIVVDNDDMPIGIITRGDVVRALAQVVA